MNDFLYLVKRQLYLGIFFASLSFLVYSCQVDDNSLILEKEKLISIDSLSLVKNKLLSMGFDTLDVADVGKYYSVENDVLIDKASINSYLQTRQFTTNFVVKTGTTIRISIDGSTISKSSGWTEAMKQVAEIYHEYAGFDFVFVDNQPDIVVTKGYLYPMNVCAQGVFPSSDGKPGNRIYINNTFYKDIDGYLSHSQKVFLLMHELGHNLGLRHSDCRKNGEDTKDGMNLVPGTPESDEDSYMNSSTCGKDWTHMSISDARTLETLWPYSFNIHFEDSNISDIEVKQRRKIYLSRYLIPKKKGYVFSGWRYSRDAYTPFCYNTPITADRTLYAAWRQPAGDRIKKNVYTGEGENSITFFLSIATPVTFTSQVNRALNSWYELRNAEGTYSKIEKLNDENCKTSLIIDMRDDEMWVKDDPNFVTRTVTIMLEEGQYKLTSSITKMLGDQNSTSNGKHGSVVSKIEYY